MSDPKQKFEITREAGKPPRRQDKRDFAEFLRDAADNYLNTSGKKTRRFGEKGQTMDEVIDEAVTGAKGAHPDY
jgi:hypothetical protein